MKATRNSREIEIKLRLPGVREGRALLRKTGFRLLKRRTFEHNTAFDTLGLDLRKGGTLLRVRQAGKTATLTYKGPAIPGPHKSREEVETKVADAESLSRILERLGYQPCWRYEKFRTEYRLGSGVATLDETPIGVFLELEGPPDWIDRTARRLGFSAAVYITASYATLYLEWCRENGVDPSHMTFAADAPRKNR